MKEGIVQPSLQERLQTTSLESMFAAGVERFAIMREQPHQAVEQNRARRRLKSGAVAPVAADLCRENNHRCHAAQVYQDAMLPRIVKQERIAERRQRQALAANGEITARKIRQRC